MKDPAAQRIWHHRAWIISIIHEELLRFHLMNQPDSLSGAVLLLLLLLDNSRALVSRMRSAFSTPNIWPMITARRSAVNTPPKTASHPNLFLEGLLSGLVR